MTTTTLPLLPRRVPAPVARRTAPLPAPVPPPGVWAEPTVEVLRSLASALARWSA
ncbi:hypothetical protein [Streptomyces geranii]|uniref:hypothetical protein n=1 Tax=Streptomyces geranii TaxID=2058923 RepID=UPI0013003073|nr:hypothetical protein [Streptomyces geranii]